MGLLSEMCLGEYPLPIAGPAQTPASTPPTMTNAQRMWGPSDGWCGLYCVLLQVPYNRYIVSVLEWLERLVAKLAPKKSTTVDATPSLSPPPSPGRPLDPLSSPPPHSLSPPGTHGAQPAPENEVVQLRLQVALLEVEVGFLSKYFHIPFLN